MNLYTNSSIIELVIGNSFRKRVSDENDWDRNLRWKLGWILAYLNWDEDWDENRNRT